MKTLGDTIRQAIAEQDGPKAGRISDYLRFHKGMRYSQIFDFAKHCSGGTLELADWDALLYESDRLDSLR